MNCMGCRYYPLDSAAYPCSECSGHDMYKDKNGTCDVGDDMIMLINEVHNLRKVVEKLLEKE